MEIEREVYHSSVDTVNRLIEQSKDNVFYSSNPKLDFLTDLLCKQIHKRNENARGLVLVSRTLHAKLLFDYFKERVDIQVNQFDFHGKEIIEVRIGRDQTLLVSWTNRC